ncbi:hypothetical protein RE6C_03253 [Rhodopirellula europaea 6C]|uniref:Uncharacterized protein n=1 Tax=Rhodopirellula europaea 6C TaxID=1263867 RepID=M2AFX7_9BACT|nr:hypothetical protein RE6C_03253 [Rhodopirellula europaea 6C]
MAMWNGVGDELGELSQVLYCPWNEAFEKQSVHFGMADSSLIQWAIPFQCCPSTLPFHLRWRLGRR